MSTKTNFRSRSKSFITDEGIQLLISYVQRNPSLWDDGHSAFKDTCLSRKLWGEIADQLNITGDEAKKRWKSLKDTYRKIFKTIPQPTPGSLAVPFKPTWKFWKPLYFLQEIFAVNETYENLTIKDENSSLSESGDNYIDEIDESTQGARFEDISALPGMPSEIPSDREEGASSQQDLTIQDILSVSKRKRTTNSEDENILELEHQKLYPVISMNPQQQEPGAKRTRFANYEGENKREQLDRSPIIAMQHQEKRNDNYLFLMSILPYMDKLSDLQRLEIRAEIHNLVLKYYRQVEDSSVQ